MIVVVIIGILAALAIPRFMTATVKSKQSEAKGILKQMYTMERTYRQQHNDYWGAGVTGGPGASQAFATIGVEIPADAIYTYTIVTALTPNLLIRATCNLDDGPAIDTWEIDDAGSLVCTVDDVVLD
jgi:type II secretory pathway pseudopilin PulG